MGFNIINKPNYFTYFKFTTSSKTHRNNVANRITFIYTFSGLQMTFSATRSTVTTSANTSLEQVTKYQEVLMYLVAFMQQVIFVSQQVRRRFSRSPVALVIVQVCGCLLGSVTATSIVRSKLS